MSQITNLVSGGGGGSITIAGDTGSTTGTSFTFDGGSSGAVFSMSAGTMTESFNYLALPTTTSTNGQITINGNRFLHSYGTRNTFIGQDAGNFTLTTGSAQANNCVGKDSLASLTTGAVNNAMGELTLNACTSGEQNCAFGHVSLTSLTTGSFNLGFGPTTLAGLTTGNFNIGVGYAAGNNYTGAESSNILMNSTGTVGESNTLRIGSGTGTGNQQLDEAYICGINGNTVTGSPVVVNSSNKLGAGGIVTNTSQPAFRAYLSDAITNVTGDGTNYTVIFNSEVFDRGSNYDNTTGIFTAPVAGIYQFNFAIGYQNINATHGTGAIFLFAGGIQYVGQLVNSFAVASSGVWQSNLTVIVSLAASDTVYCIAYIAGGTKTVDLYNDQSFTYFSGALLF